MSAKAFASIDPAAYVPHELHRAERSWNESNCYIDVWIELLHALKLDPAACLPFTLAVDFEGDQWTFFKPPHEDLIELYGIDVQELNVWRPLIQVAREHVANGKVVLTEADAFFLPDTAGTDYRTQHTKTTIAIQEIDEASRTLRYFHNGGYYGLSGADFVGLFRIDTPPDPAYMPFFAEFVRLARIERKPENALAQTSRELLRKHLARRPDTNPVARFEERFTADVTWLKTAGLATYHGYAFATLRQLGASFELAAYYLRWLQARGEADLTPIAAEFDQISSTAKALILKTARAVNGNKSVDFAPQMAVMKESWARGMDGLASRFGR